MAENGRDAVNFDELIQEMKNEVVAQGATPTMKAGACAEADLATWLGELDTESFSVAIWEYTDHTAIGEAMQPDDIQWLEHARLFGAGGDLELWRDGDEFRWRYVGQSENAPSGEQSLSWPATPENPVYCQERTALLWGEHKAEQSQWYDDRTAGAALTYPVEGAPDRVRVRYKAYTQAGQVLAIWYTGLEGYNG